MPKTMALLLFATAAYVFAQSKQSGPSFEAASVKIYKLQQDAVPIGMKGGPGTSDPSRITYQGLSMIALLQKAWGWDTFRIAGPAWMSDFNQAYEVIATIPASTTKAQFQSMLQNLLAERFQIKLHHEVRTYPGYELMVAPGGAKLKPAADPDIQPARGPTGKQDENGFLVLLPGRGAGVTLVNGVHASFQSYSMSDFAESNYLKSFLRMATGTGDYYVADKTSLRGKYDFKFKFAGEPSDVVVGPAVQTRLHETEATPYSLPSLFAAMEKQLGLKLVKSKGFPLDTIVIDQIEKAPIE
jgi:uncharacterized protein (TIGR03435 family)